MSKLSKIFFIMVSILSIFCVTQVYATDINMNLASNITNDTLDDDTTTNTQTTAVNNNSSIPESGLGLSNVLNILLITVGVILILLGVAIMIRLKH